MSKIEKNKIVHLGRDERDGEVFCNIKITERDGNNKLSISGVIGPKPNGDCRGSCGQINKSWNILSYASGWSEDLVNKFSDIWDRWHLNDMRAGCEHQRESDSFNHLKKILLHYRSVNWKEYDNLVKKLRSDARAQGFFDPDPKNQEDLYKMRNFSSAATILNLLLEMKLEAFCKTPIDENRWNVFLGSLLINEREFFDKAIETTTEEKFAGWVSYKEHPEGILTKPCHVCGYKYGSAWLYEEVPQDVLDFLMSLPDTDTQPAWV